MSQFASLLNTELKPVVQWAEVSSSLQIPAFHIVGLPGREVAEARERVRAAIEASGLEFPRRRVVLNLSPAYIPKRGTGADLTIALAVLASCASEASLRKSALSDPNFRVLAWAELGLDGSLKNMGQLTRAVYACWSSGIQQLIVAESELTSAIAARELIAGARIFETPAPAVCGVSRLEEAWSFLQKGPASDRSYSIEAQKSVENPVKTLRFPPASNGLLPLSPSLERAIGVSIAGAHHLMILGPKGTGKSHSLSWIRALQPEAPLFLQVQQRLLNELESEKKQDARSHAASPSAHTCNSTELLPFRTVGAHARPAALLGSCHAGGVRPGEFSLANGGVLVADEILEWPRDTRECLREPMESGTVTLTRAQASVELPARFRLAATGNLCPCGGWPPELRLSDDLNAPSCRCSPHERTRYLKKLSGPVLDRTDLVLLAQRAPVAAGFARDQMEGRTSLLRQRIALTQERMLKAWKALPGEMSGAQIEEIFSGSTGDQDFFRDFSLRGRHKILRLALSLSAWDHTNENQLKLPGLAHLTEASLYRPERLGI